MSNIISINVGGTVFSTTKTTLTVDPESMLARMCDTELSHERDSNGNIFLDRNPKAFEIILEFLRTGKLFNVGIGCTLEQLEAEADYFGLVGLLEMIKEQKSLSDDGGRELIFVITSKGSISGPILNLEVDGHSATAYTFVGLREFQNAMRSTFPTKKRKELARPIRGNDWTEKTICIFGKGLNEEIKAKRSVWFSVRDKEEENILPPTKDMIDMEARILKDWEHYWKSAEDCRKTKKIKMKVGTFERKSGRFKSV